eukprot:TRINITY_DN12272_c0_g2_i1.p1 TRINITY_DN12272_c0_g2~~TRINITY_DN12272_c0_g2_i1.p1  ORF type:complete len:972 (+),score=151.00 TRINITY_DN12272_c0_g2_i1:340-2916(+)
MVLVIAFIFLCIFGLREDWSCCFGPHTTEHIAVFFNCLNLVVVPFVDGWYCSKLVGVDPRVFLEGSPPFNDTRLIMYMQFVLLSAHTAPVRWCKMLAVEVCAILVYTGCILLGGPEGTQSSVLNLVCLGITLGTFTIGKRALEFQERKAVLAYLIEKELRCLSEFKLSQTLGQACVSGGELDKMSRPETTSTGKVLLDGHNRMDEVKQIGLAEQWLIGVGELKIDADRILGEGGFGVVVSGRYNGCAVAVKAPKGSSHNNGNQKQLISLLNEFRAMRRLRHSNIVSLFGVIVDTEATSIALVLEEVRGLSLDEFIRGTPRGKGAKSESSIYTPPLAMSTNASDSERVTALRGICSALQYLHLRKPAAVVHGDLKSSNVIVERLVLGSTGAAGGEQIHCRAKLLDFGLARVLTRNAKPLGGTVNWVAPEVASTVRRPPSSSADVFSFGRLAYFVLTSFIPLANKTREEILRSLRKQVPWFEMEWPVDTAVNETAASADLVRRWRPIVSRCVEQDPSTRPSTMLLLESSVLAEPVPEDRGRPSGTGGTANGRSTSASADDGERRRSGTGSGAHRSTSQSRREQSAKTADEGGPEDEKEVGFSFKSLRVAMAHRDRDREAERRERHRAREHDRGQDRDQDREPATASTNGGSHTGRRSPSTERQYEGDVPPPPPAQPPAPSGGPQKKARVVDARFRRTPENTVMLALINAMGRCNPEVPRNQACCSFHACSWAMQRSIKSLDRSPCKHGFLNRVRQQCDVCCALVPSVNLNNVATALKARNADSQNGEAGAGDEVKIDGGITVAGVNSAVPEPALCCQICGNSADQMREAAEVSRRSPRAHLAPTKAADEEGGASRMRICL